MNKIFQIDPHNPIFPDANKAHDEGLIAWSKLINEKMVLNAYKAGAFPWYNENTPVLWWSPNPRVVIFPNELKISRSLRQSIKKFNIKENENFESVIRACQQIRLENDEETWINEDIIDIYTKLNKKQITKSIEVYCDDELVGGLYGVVIGKVFCGESMFSKKRDASKVALVYLANSLKEIHNSLIDCQLPNSHLFSMGAREIPRRKFLEFLK